MAEALFDIFGDHLMRQSMKNVSRQPLFNNENIGKTVKPVSNIPVKLNEPLKKAGGPKKSFLSNKGKALQSTPAPLCSPQLRNIAVSAKKIFSTQVIYSDADGDIDDHYFDELRFEPPKYLNNNFHMDLLDLFPLPECETNNRTPSPVFKAKPQTMEFDCSYKDEFFTDDFSNESIPLEESLDLPDLF